MNIYETVYMINVTNSLVGQMYMDTITVIFAVMITGYFVGSRLTKTMLYALLFASSAFVLMMLANLVQISDRAVSLADSLPADQFEALPYLVHFNVDNSVMGDFAIALILLPLVLAHTAAVFFVLHCHKTDVVTAAS